MERRIIYYFERSYPYLAGIATVVACKRLNINIYVDDNYNDLLNGLITLTSLIIGFLGAVMPVLVSMKNDSIYVKYVFERDKDRLFMKYMKTALLFGILDVVMSLAMYVRSSFPIEWVSASYHAWILITVIFLIATYRSMSHMMSLVFNGMDYSNTGTGRMSENRLTDEQKKSLHEEFK